MNRESGPLRAIGPCAGHAWLAFRGTGTDDLLGASKQGREEDRRVGGSSSRTIDILPGLKAEDSYCAKGTSVGS
jgi:hypothetical protein